jgi:hypothetical protein
VESAGTELSGTVRADNDAPDFSATNAPVSSSMIAAAASARAQAQLDALRTDTSLEWTAGLTTDSGFTNDTSLSSTTVEGIDHLALLVDVNPWVAEWLPPAIEDTPLTLADGAAHRFGGVGFGGGASGLSGGGAAGGGSGAGEISDRSAGAFAQSTLQTPRAQTTTKAAVHPSSHGTTAATAAPMIGAVLGTMVHRSRRWLVVLMFRRALASRSRSQSPRAPCSRRLGWRAWRRPVCADEPAASQSPRYSNSFTRSSHVCPVTPSTAIDCCLGAVPVAMAIATRPCSHESTRDSGL